MKQNAVSTDPRHPGLDCARPLKPSSSVPTLKDLLDQANALLMAYASSLGIDIGPGYAVEADTGYIAPWFIGENPKIADINECVEKIRSLCTRLGDVEVSQCVRYGADAICCGTVTVVGRECDGGSCTVVIIVLPSARVAKARRGLDIARTIIPLAEVPELQAA